MQLKFTSATDSYGQPIRDRDNLMIDGEEYFVSWDDDDEEYKAIDRHMTDYPLTEIISGRQVKVIGNRGY